MPLRTVVELVNTCTPCLWFDWKVTCHDRIWYQW